MNTNKIVTSFVMVALWSSACVPTPPPTPPIIPITGGPIGIISAEKTLVESGPSDSLEQVINTAEFYDSNTVRVTNGGVAKLDISIGQTDNKISLSIFNETAVDDVKIDPSGTTDPFVTLLLVFGGVTGEVPKNGSMPAQFTTPNGVNIYILGTQFLVVYDPETSTTYIGNFDGTIAYSMPPRQSVQFTQAGELYEISSNFEIKQSTLNFSRADIENITSNTRSRLQDALKEYLEPTFTPTPTPTTTPTITFTPTFTLTPTKFIPCDKAAFVADVTIPDGTSFSPGFQFTKVWRLRNVGTCTWTNNYSLVFSGGESMSGPASVSLASMVTPGQTIDIAVNLVAPQLSGTYRGDWMLRSPSGALFGAGATGMTPIWIKINVLGLPDMSVSIGSGPTVTCDPNIGTICSFITTVGFVIRNTSQTDVTSTFQVLIDAIGLQSVTITVNQLAAGSSQTFVQTFRGGCFNPDCTARVTVDSGNAILEANETNNTTQNTIQPGAIIVNAFIMDGSKRIPSQGVTVTLYDSTGKKRITSKITDSNGQYKFINLSPGVYFVGWDDITCGAPVPTEEPVTVNSGDPPANKDIDLTSPIC